MARFIYSEARIADAIGVSRDEIRQIRDVHLSSKLHWKKIGREILLTESALKSMIDLFVRTKLFAATPPKLSDCLPQKHGTNGARKKMRIVAIPMNPRMVLANEAGDPAMDQLLVYVGRNATFAFGDEIEVGPMEGQKGIWQLTSELPRDRRRPR